MYMFAAHGFCHAASTSLQELVGRSSADLPLLHLGLFTCLLALGESIPHVAPAKLTPVRKGLHSQSVRILVSWQSQPQFKQLRKSCLKSAKTFHTHLWSTSVKKARHACYSQTPHLLASEKKGRNKELEEKMTESDHLACACK